MSSYFVVQSVHPDVQNVPHYFVVQAVHLDVQKWVI